MKDALIAVRDWCAIFLLLGTLVFLFFVFLLIREGIFRW